MKTIKEYLNYDAIGACAWILSGISRIYEKNSILKGVSFVLLLIFVFTFIVNKEDSCLKIKTLRFVESVALLAVFIGGNKLDDYRPIVYIGAGIIHLLCWGIFLRSKVKC